MNTTKEKEILEGIFNNHTALWININLDPRKMVDRVEGYVIVAAVFMIILAIGTPRRRQSRSIIIRYGVDGVFILSFPLLSYTMGSMKEQIIKNQLYPVWAMFLAIFFGGTNAMSVQKLDDNKQPMKIYYEWLLFSFYFGAVLGGFIHMHNELPYIGYATMAVSFLFSFKNAERYTAAYLASKPSSQNGIKRLARYMKHEHQLSTSYNPCNMQGYKYPVLIHSATPVTLDKIWCDNIGVLSSSNSSAPIRCLKDLSLSFALFNLAVRRYFGYNCPESKLDKTRDLVLDGLLRTEQDYERAFHVIEVELAFLHDFFFTKYAFIMYGREVWCCALSLTGTFLSIAVGIWALSVLKTHPSVLVDRLVETSTRDILVTKIVFVALSIFQVIEIWSYCVSDWAKVSLVCKYVENPSWQRNARIEKLLFLLGRSQGWLRYWRNNIGQYSVLDSFSSSYRDQLEHRFYSKKARKPIELPMEVKKAVAWTIKNSILSHLSNGASTLMRHGMSDELCWACQIGDEFTLTHSILVWHIATSYCEISEKVRSGNYVVHPKLAATQFVATSLSRYCAYLVAFAPMLLPGSPLETECTLDELVGETKEAFQNLISPWEKYQKLRELHNVYARDTMPAQLLAKGVMLGKALESMRNRVVRWDLLADFWAEMLVYIAPSDNVAGHIERLAEGGEFVTHVWALLMHAGILERPAAGTAAP